MNGSTGSVSRSRAANRPGFAPLRSVLLAALFVMPVFILLPHLAQIPFHPLSDYSDLLVSHEPNARYLQDTLRTWGRVPFWSPLILSGYPFAANPLSGLFYPPGWLGLLFPLPVGLNLMVAAHLIFGGVGMYRFLRKEGVGSAGALLGGLTFAALPKLYAHFGAGHLTLLYAVPWTPWLLLANRSIVTGVATMNWRRSLLIGLLPGAVLSMIALADVRWTAYAGLVWGAEVLRGLWADWALPERQGAALNQLSACFSTVIFALLGAAVLLLPLAEYTGLSTRSLMTAEERFTLSMPPGQLFGLFVPVIGGSAEWVLYPGAVTAALALYALGAPALRRKTAFWLGVVGLSLVFALGSNIPGLDLVTRLPGFDLLRVPPRMLFLSGMGFAVIAGYALDSLVRQAADAGSPARDRSGLLLFAVTTFLALLAAATWWIVDQPMPRIQFTWGALVLVGATTLVFLARGRRIQPGALAVLLIVLSLSDLMGLNRLSLTFKNEKAVIGPAQAAAEFLAGERESGPFRVYSPSYSLPQHVAVAYGLELADGVDPLQLAAYVNAMRPATGVPGDGYSVTLPPFAQGDPETDNRAYTPSAQALGLFNVRFVAAEFELSASGLLLRERFGQTRIYENTEWLPRAWVQSPEAAPGEGTIRDAVTQPGVDEVRVAASGPGLLVLSEPAYPGWQVTLDGAPAAMETVAGVLRGVRLPEGDHQVVFRFRPLRVYLGLAISVLAWLALPVLWWVGRSVYGRTL